MKRVFIANRGEIARRIAISAKSLGIVTVAVRNGTPPNYLSGLVDHYVTTEREDAALYNDIDGMVSMALAAGCDAVHPGFGFLSENSTFAERILASGMIFVGPSSEAIRLMGSKALAREIAERCGVLCVPGMRQDFAIKSQHDLAHFLEFSRKIGYPVLVKAALSGGGRGMHLMRSEEDFNYKKLLANPDIRHSMEQSSLIVEKYFTSARHIEIQIVADQHGQITTVGDRECSIQRRYQKIVEEAPAVLRDAVREQMYAAALRLTREVGYDNVGTVEFLVDRTNEGNDCFYFLEMNTRLQVEHTVTEQAYGVDLVELQFQSAMGEGLPPHMFGRQATKHSIEMRIYAENYKKGFLPTPGVVRAFEPFYTHYLRWEIGIDAVDEVTTHFDPMIAKVISTGETRAAAIDRLRVALAKTVYVGPSSNIPLLKWILNNEDFRNHHFDTEFISQKMEQIILDVDREKKQFRADYAYLLDEPRLFPVFALPEKSHHISFDLTRHIFNAHKPGHHDLAADNVIICEEQVRLSPRLPRITSRIRRGVILLSDQKWREFWLVETRTPKGGKETTLSIGGRSVTRRIEPRSLKEVKISLGYCHNEAIAPVPGKVIHLVANQRGQRFLKNETIMTLESMKMEFEIKAPFDLEVTSVHVKEGALVKADQPLVEWKPLPA